MDDSGCYLHIRAYGSRPTIGRITTVVQTCQSEISRFIMIHVAQLLSFTLFLCLLDAAAAQIVTLLVLDAGVGHRSSPVPRWHTVLRSLTPSGTNATVLKSFGPESTLESSAEPINAYSLAYTNTTGDAYVATG
ncbi:hypothetical protein NX059_003479 [Plenodomus lindquistii]|nr:hypothetical protein NX059_003479 [Plenodomus lindquistii]